MGEKRLAGFLARQGYCGGKSAAELLGRLRSAPEGRAQEAEEEAHRRPPCFRWWPPSSPSSNRSGGSTRGSPTPCAHPDGEVFLSLFRDPGSTLTGAKLLCEIGDQRERYPTAEALAADAGMCPVAKESGKRKVATFRRACNKRLRYILATLADSSRQHNPWAKDIYLRARGRGCEHPHAIRILGRAWVRVIYLAHVARRRPLRSSEARRSAPQRALRLTQGV